ncbi:hypothetical protein [Candidatus Nitronereus thalassa]|uniref:Tetratricopeptide repeat protein n=1 Tax=Candidatus Nitronereus thalassa TaxID=3020898 RepID=A0ABU3KC86_9BACT|nr:hypothetical protein [Candidatus Nitronereus thalassa]MDT7044036.1 hypothetical protein [Candidatus Nitronereus thalassa]
MNRNRYVLGIIALVLVLSGCTTVSPEQASSSHVPLFEGLGDFHYPITTNSSQAQNYFDQGMVLAYAFNHAEAHRSFVEAARLDPNCSMCYWGQALVLGPNINAPMADAAIPIAYEAISHAKQHAKSASTKEQALINALGHRYASDAQADRGALDQSYAAAMREVQAAYPHDSTVASLFAESLMDLHPWNFWDKTGKPHDWTPEILNVLENTLRLDPNHPLANHLYIHAVEASPEPERGVPSADRLRTLVPGAGHLVHMPGHIYIRVGRYRDAIQANQHATKADAGYLSHSHTEGLYPLAYVPHNHHFLWAAATKLGMKKVSLESAMDTAHHVDQTMLTNPGIGATLQHFSIIPLYTKALFGEWQSIFREPAPEFLYPKGVWHYARGLAYLRKGNMEYAQQELAALQRIANDPAIADLTILGLNSVSLLLQIGTEILAGELAVAQQHTDKAVAHLQHAIALEDGLTYTEPKDWYLPPRQVLGAVLLEAGRAKEAEQVYRQDLEYHPQSGWSLFGLKESLKAQGQTQEMQLVEAQFQKAWADADVTLTSSRF